MQPSLAIAGILGLSLIISVSIFVVGRLRIEQQRTLQKVIERGASGDELARAAGLGDRSSTDARRGILLVAVGLSWSVVTFFAGGKAWMVGVVPIAIGLAFLSFRMLNDRAR
jgi:uncharacterized protein DUF6249